MIINSKLFRSAIFENTADRLQNEHILSFVQILRFNKKAVIYKFLANKSVKSKQLEHPNILERSESLSI